MRRIWVILLLCFSIGACAETPMQSHSRSGGGGSSPSPDYAGWVHLDMSPTERYVDMYGPVALIEGRAEAQAGIASVTVGGAPTRVGADGSFMAEVSVSPGVQLIPVVATDNEGRQRKGHRSVIVADFLPEGQMNSESVYLAVSQAMADALAGELAGAVPDVDIGREIRARGYLSRDDQCTTRATSVSHEPAHVELSVRETGLFVEVHIPNLRIEFEGECNVPLIGSFTVTGSMSGTPIIEAPVFGQAPEDSCLVGLQTEGVQTRIADWDFSFTPHGLSLRDMLLVRVFSGGMGDDARDQLAGEISTTAVPLLEEELRDIEVFNSAETLNLFDRDATVELCSTFLGLRGGNLMVGVGARVSGAGGTGAPGAPILRGEVPDASGNVMLLDSQLVSQLLFSAWRSGGLDTTVSSETTFQTIALLSPGLQGLFPPEAPIVAVTRAELPPVLRASPIEEGSEADLQIEIPDMRLDLQVEGTTLFTLMSTIRMQLRLVPNDAGELVPTPVSVETEAHMIEEPILDIADGLLEAVMGDMVSDEAGNLLDGATIALPSLGGAIVPVDVTPEAGGRYLVVTLR